MTTYTIIPTADGSGFNIGIAGSNGARQTMLGFASEAEAEAWIDQDKRLDGAPASQSLPDFSQTPAALIPPENDAAEAVAAGASGRAAD